MDEVYADDTLESYQVHYNENQRWYFLRDQNVSEYLIFKSADSHVQGTGKSTSTPTFARPLTVMF
jgi:hypothetical protein